MTFNDIIKLNKIEILVFTNKILLVHSYVHSFKNVAASALQIAESIVSTEIEWLTNLKYFII